MKTIETLELNSLSTLMDEAVPRMGCLRTPLYRGQESILQSILPRLLRMNIENTEFSNWTDLESSMLQQFKQHGAADLDFEPVSELEWQMLAAHKELPTRLTNWSENPLVGLFFATAPSEEDGVLWRLLPGDRTLIASQDYQLAPEEVQIPHPRQTDRSLFAQRGCFLSHPVPKLDTSPISFEDYYETLDNRDYRLHLTKIVVPQEKKAQFRQQLSVLGIDARALFPGLSGLAKQIEATSYAHTGSYDWVF